MSPSKHDLTGPALAHHFWQTSVGLLVAQHGYTNGGIP